MLRMFPAVALAAALVPDAAAQLGQHHPGALEADLSAFELPSGEVRVRVLGGPAFGAGRLALEAPGGAASATPIALDGTGSWSVDLPRATAAALAGTRLRADLTGPDGTSAPVNALVLGSWEASSTQRGDVIFAEFMKDPSFVSDSNGEWVELVNPGTATKQIAGWMIHDGGSNAHVIQPGGPFILVAPGKTFLMGNEIDPTLNGGVPVQYEYSSFSLSNGSDELFLTARNGSLVDAVVYDDGVLWPDTPGAAISLDPLAFDAVDNDDPANWCEASSPIGAGNPDLGTPGAPNGTCP